VELLVVIAVTALLLLLMLPALGGAREAGRTAVCLSNQRQLVAGWTLYAADYRGQAMPLGREQGPDIVYWFGAVEAGPPARVEHERGFLSPYLESGLSPRSAYECPAQPWGSYRAQPASIPPPGLPTSTYGYNGYGLCPPMTPGWSIVIGSRRWLAIADIQRPSELFVFADTLLAGSPPRNDALLDPPQLWDGLAWTVNPSPTTCFRHGAPGSAATARVDGSARGATAEPAWLVDGALRIGSVGTENGPHYVEDWRSWR
jgi:hypothetical protein